MKEEILGFFRNNSNNSMNRLIVFLCALAAMVASVGAVWLGFKNLLTYDYITLVAILWGAVFGGKNWSRAIERKNGKLNEKH